MSMWSCTAKNSH